MQKKFYNQRLLLQLKMPVLVKMDIKHLSYIFTKQLSQIL